MDWKLFQDSVLGFPLAVVAAVLVVTALYYMARHSVLLFGHVHVLPEEKGGKGANVVCNRYRYSFFVQNAEDVTYPGPITIQLCTDVSHHSLRRDQIKVFGGPRAMDFRPKNATREEEYCCAVLRFAELPPFDTWRIDVISEVTALSLRVVTENEGSLLQGKLIKDLYPRELSLSPVGAPRAAAGATATPSFAIWAVLWPAMTCVYIAAVVLVGKYASNLVDPDFGELGWLDLIVVTVLSMVLWRGYKRIQRPVYPIIQGYRDDSVSVQESGPTIDDSANSG